MKLIICQSNIVDNKFSFVGINTYQNKNPQAEQPWNILKNHFALVRPPGEVGDTGQIRPTDDVLHGDVVLLVAGADQSLLVTVS